MPPKKKTANEKNGKEKHGKEKRESVVSEAEGEVSTPKSDESKSDYSEVGGSRRGSKFHEEKKEKGIATGIAAEAEELQDMKNRRQKLERTTEVLNKHDFVVQKLIMKAREDLVLYITIFILLLLIGLKHNKSFGFFTILNLSIKGLGAIYEMRWFAGSCLCSRAQYLLIIVEGG